MTDYYETEARIVAATSMALLCDIDGEEFWIPKSLLSEEGEVSGHSDVGEIGMIMIPEWFAIKEEII